MSQWVLTGHQPEGRRRRRAAAARPQGGRLHPVRAAGGHRRLPGGLRQRHAAAHHPVHGHLVGDPAGHPAGVGDADDLGGVAGGRGLHRDPQPHAAVPDQPQPAGRRDPARWRCCRPASRCCSPTGSGGPPHHLGDPAGDGPPPVRRRRRPRCRWSTARRWRWSGRASACRSAGCGRSTSSTCGSGPASGWRSWAPTARGRPR